MAWRAAAACLLVLALALTCADDTPVPSGKPLSGVRVRSAVLAKRQAHIVVHCETTGAAKK